MIVSAKKRFWFDELVTYTLAADPSLSHMIGALADQVDGAPPTLHLVMWSVARVFSPSELSLRMVSACAMAVALLLMWRVLARSLPLHAVAIGLLTPFCLSTLLLLQNAEARFYGVFMALTALGFWWYDRWGQDKAEGTRSLAGHALTHGALACLHVWGLFFSGAILAAHLTRDAVEGRFRPRAYLSLMAGWLAFAAWLPAFHWQMQLARPRSWMLPPTVADLLDAYAFKLPFPLLVLALLFVATLLRIDALRSGVALAPLPAGADQMASRADLSARIFAFALLAVPLAGWVLSRTFAPAFQDRYALPALLGWAILFSIAVARTMSYPQSEGESHGTWWGHAARGAICVWVAGLVGSPVVYGWLVTPQTDLYLADEAWEHLDLPVATESAHSYHAPGTLYTPTWSISFHSGPGQRIRSAERRF